jgi:hypothetical protein
VDLLHHLTSKLWALVCGPFFGEAMKSKDIIQIKLCYTNRSNGFVGRDEMDYFRKSVYYYQDAVITIGLREFHNHIRCDVFPWASRDWE